MDSGASLWQRFLDGLRRAGEFIMDGATVVALGLDTFFVMVANLMETCSAYGWCFAPDSSFVVLIEAVHRVNTSPRPHHELYRILRDHFRADDWAELENLVKRMRATHPKRLKILHDCVATMRAHGQYVGGRTYNACNLVVPTLVAVVEGMLVDFARDIGLSRWNRKRFEILRAELMSVSFAFDKPALDLVFGVLFSPADASSDEVPDSGLRFNRHKIMHGNWLHYGRIENVIRLFLMARFLDYIVEEYWQRRESGSTTPVTEPSRYSKMLSENIVEPVRDVLRARAEQRGLVLSEAAEATLRLPE